MMYEDIIPKTVMRKMARDMFDSITGLPGFTQDLSDTEFDDMLSRWAENQAKYCHECGRPYDTDSN